MNNNYLKGIYFTKNEIKNRLRKMGIETKSDNKKELNSIYDIALQDDSKKEKRNDYVFENNSSDAATSMYFEYTVELSDEYKNKADFKEDGTFYRYNKVIYSRIQDIIDAYKDVKAIFDGKDAATVKAELEAAKTAPTAEGQPTVESKLDNFRQTYKIEVFNCGKTYYKQAIKDKYIGYENAIQRNSIYRLTVNNNSKSS